MASPPAHPRSGQPTDQRAALPVSGVTGLPSDGHRAGGLGAQHEKRADFGQVHRPEETHVGRALAGAASGVWGGGVDGWAVSFEYEFISYSIQSTLLLKIYTFDLMPNKDYELSLKNFAQNGWVNFNSISFNFINFLADRLRLNKSLASKVN